MTTLVSPSPALLARLSALEARVACLEAQPVALAADALPDEVLTIRQACARQKWSYSWARRRWAKLGGFLDDDRKLKIRASKLSTP